MTLKNKIFCEKVGYQVVGAPDKDANGVRLVFDSCDLKNFSSVRLTFVVDQLGVSKLVWAEAVNMGHWLAAKGPADEWHIGPLDIGDHHNFFLGQEMKRELVYGVS